jgi:hypothetical protein
LATISRPLRAEARARANGYSGATALDNLALACSNCNRHKGARTEATDPRTGEKTRLFNPRRDLWQDHYEWSNDGLRVIGKTEIGRATVEALRMNDGVIVFSRAFWVSFGAHPPK